jgi:hypothetical protein
MPGRKTRQIIRAVLLIFFICINLMYTTYASEQDDSYLKGYLDSILEQHLNWDNHEYNLSVKNGIANISTSGITDMQIEEAKQAFSEVPGVIDFNFTNDESINKEVSFVYIHYPRNDYFKAGIADIKEPQFFMSLLELETPDHTSDFTMASVGLGHSFGLYRWPSSILSSGWQLSFSGGLFSQFNLDAQSDALINSDYLIGFPLTFRKENLSGRIRLMHQSSHLGDELLLGDNPPERVDVSFEFIDIIIAQDIENWKIMLGGFQIIRQRIDDVKKLGITAGIDYRNPTPVLGNSLFIAGIYTTWPEENDWEAGTSLKLGLQVGSANQKYNSTRIMLEAYKGFAPFGQFYSTNIEYYGVGVYFDFN